MTEFPRHASFDAVADEMCDRVLQLAAGAANPNLVGQLLCQSFTGFTPELTNWRPAMAHCYFAAADEKADGLTVAESLWGLHWLYRGYDVLSGSASTGEFDLSHRQRVFLRSPGNSYVPRARETAPPQLARETLQVALLAASRHKSPLVQKTVESLTVDVGGMIPYWMLEVTDGPGETPDHTLIAYLFKSNPIRNAFRLLAEGDFGLTPEDADDAFSAWFARLLDRPPTHLGIVMAPDADKLPELRTWIRNHLQDERRFRLAKTRGGGLKHSSHQADALPDPRTVQADACRREMLRSAFEATYELLGPHRAGMVRRLAEGNTVEEVARELGCTIHRVNYAKALAREHLTRLLPSEWLPGAYRQSMED